MNTLCNETWLVLNSVLAEDKTVYRQHRCLKKLNHEDQHACVYCKSTKER